jgi:diguanylate cyclase (GGDEF)-like protein
VAVYSTGVVAVPFEQSSEIRLLKDVADISAGETCLQDGYAKLFALLSSYFSCAVRAWTWDQGIRIEPIQQASADFPMSLAELRVRLATHDYSWSLRPDGRFLLLQVKLRAMPSLLLDIGPVVMRQGEAYLEMLVTQAALVLQAIERGERARKQNRLLELVNAASRLATDGEGLEQIAIHIVRFLRERFHCTLVSMHLLDPYRQSLQVLAFDSKYPDRLDQAAQTSIRVGIVGRAARLAEPQLVNDVHADPHYIAFTTQVISEYAVPIIRRGDVLGVLNLESERAHIFDSEVQLILRTLADQLSGAIYLAKMNAELDSQHLQMCQREQTLQRVNAKLLRANQSLKKLSMIDGLTGVANRRAFALQLKDIWKTHQQIAQPVSAVLSDLDFFKHYNDGLGHLAGDDALRMVARAMQRNVPPGGALLARYGGEEFAVVLPGADAQVAQDFAERQRRAVEKLGLICNGRALTLSAGIASLTPKRGVISEQLISSADQALYLAKAQGRNRVVCLA